jgi:eukaryotic-like serine/threonine-protein kinase
MLIDVGQVVAKKYELARLLGRGSMGEVWSAHHQALREQVALKLLAWPPSGEDAESPAVALERFRFEAQVAARLSKKTRHIVRVTDYGEDDGLPYLVMELLDGEALDASLRRRGVLPPAEAAQVVSQIARALDHAHAEGVAHRDLKPGNVFLTRDEEGNLLVKLLDFGIARPIHARRLLGTFSTAKGFVFGTPGYMGPEQTRASPKLDHRCDLWALATIGYQMLSGHLPVDGGDTDEIMKNICAGRIVSIRQRDARLPESLDAFFDRAFADNVDDRFAGASPLAQAFERACLAMSAASLDTTSTPDSVSTGIEFSSTLAHEVVFEHRRARIRLLIASGGAVFLLAAIGGVWRGLASPRDSAVSPNVLGPSLDESAAVVRLAPSAAAEPVLAASSWTPVPPASPSASSPAHLALTAPASPNRAKSATPSLPARPFDAPDAASPAVHPTRVPSRASEDRNDVF